MKIYIAIPAHNEADFIGLTLQSLVSQTFLPSKIVVVNDQSTDDTPKIVQDFIEKHPFIQLKNTTSSEAHQPGSKVINAFNAGLAELDENYDLICKFDADLIFPENYLETIVEIFKKDSKIGMAAGHCTIEKNGDWIIENLTDKDHIRGALKCYRKECFTAIGGLKPAMGWDTVDELLAQFHDWKIETTEKLHVKHLKPTGANYNTKASRYKQGKAFYRLGYGFLITGIASAKLAFMKKDYGLFPSYLKGYFQAKKANEPLLVSKEEGKFIRDLRWKKMKGKIIK
ncbi:glycosyltransferase family 2 protein [Zunongwangia endophytica]|uniref:Glycosyltransferase family 2 protein n=1 Tax=Zunongwangia endophytica TaxID=1808945 RepID=A0ABV8H5D2_9FLAO|nr:glycosyltransferase family 2 protein [Zunongwangia endophytica]MDN3596393.1 glycosyltransferase family 2 protein [Zunongwangia endophytica]